MNAPAAMPSPRLESERRIESDRHEPSMDEILASIRRIISEDQAQISPKAVAPEPKASPSAARAAAGSELGSAVERLRRALEPVVDKAAEAPVVKPVAPFVPPKPVRPAAPPLRTEDKSMPAPPVAPPVGAQQVEEAKAPAVELPEPVVPEATLAVEPASLESDEADADHAPDIEIEPVAAVSAFPSLERAFPDAAPVLERVAASRPVAPLEPVKSAAAEPLRDSLHAPLTGAAETLLSPVADASIASSFQTLAATMLFQDKSLMEDMAREMLRPMLKTWLDDNLPVMVERLVRAEIERVARGGRG